MKNDLRAIPETVHGIRFDSKLEATAYRMLVNTFGRSRVLCHVPVSYSSDREVFPALIHKVDFQVNDPHGIPMRYLEIKGRIDGQWNGRAAYIRTMMLLQVLRPNVFDKYILWVGNGSSRFSVKTAPLDFIQPFPLRLQDVEKSLLLPE